MKFLLALVRHPMFLAASMVLGVMAWTVWPGIAKPLSLASSAYLSLLNMGAVPLIVVGVFLGVRRMVHMPQAAARIAALVFGGAVAMIAAAFIAASLADLLTAGGDIPPSDIRRLGAMSLTSESIATISLKPEEGAKAVEDTSKRGIDNFFFALAFGSLPVVLLCAVFFAVAFAAQPKERARWLQAQFEPIYRTLELLIDGLNSFLPIVAFALAASVAAAVSSDGMVLMRSFLLPYFATVILIVFAAVAVMAAHVGRRPMEVLEALRKPIVVSLFANGPAAAIPGFIQGMCNGLGFRRDLVEFAAPLAPAFLRVGEAVFFAVVAVFVANLYGRDPSPADVAVISLLSTGAAFISLNVSGVRSIAAGSLVLAYLDLPIEALLPAFVLLEVICEGPRNVLSLLVSGALVALCSRGLPVEKPAVPAAPVWHAALPTRGVQIVLTRRRIFAAGALVAVCMTTVYLAGFGTGMLRAHPAPTTALKSAAPPRSQQP